MLDVYIIFLGVFMNVHDVIYQVCRAYPGGFEALALRMNMTAQILRNKANPSITSNHMNLHDVETLMAVTGDVRILEALACEMNCGVYALDAVDHPSDMAVLELVVRLQKSQGDVSGEIFNALEDGNVDKKEVERIKAAAVKSISHLNELLNRIEKLQA
jgi:hypothetical protein